MITITISSTELLNRLQSVSKIISAKASLPIMGDVQFVLENGELTLTGADSSGQISTKFSINTFDSTSICLEPKLLIEALKTLPEQPISLEINPLNYHTIIRYSGGKFEMVGQNTEHFPKPKSINETNSFTIPLDIFMKGINKTIICSATDELRPVMTSVLIEIEPGKLTHVASDGHSLATLESKVESLHDSVSFILPRQMALILKNILPDKKNDDVKILVGSNNIKFEYESYTIIAQKQEGNFPNYRSVIPVNNDKDLNIDCRALKNAINRVIVFANQSSKLIKFDLSKDQLGLSGQDVDYSTGADEKILCNYDGDPLKVGFNGVKLALLITSTDSDSLTVKFSDSSRPALIFPDCNNDESKLMYLIMPMMLND